MAQTVFRCPTGMPTDLLAAWHDHTLSADQTANVSAHVIDCTACQAYLSDYAQADTALRRTEVPALQERIWRGVRADIAQSPRRAGLPRPAVLGGLGAALAVTILFAAFFVFVLDNKGTTRSISIAPSATASAIPTNTVIPTPTVTSLQVSPSQGWVTATALTYGKDIAFSQSEPLTGYACGNYTNDNSKPLIIGETLDGGRTWSLPITTPFTGSDCLLFINPIDISDIVMESSNCWLVCGDDPFVASYRSRDGGQMWTKLALPPGNEQTSYTLVSHPVWAENALFVMAASGGYSIEPMNPLHEIAVSTNGGSFAWVDLTRVYAGISGSSPSVNDIFTLNTTFYVSIGYPLVKLAKTSDNGTTWTQISPKGGIPSGFISSFDGKLLYAMNNGKFYRSLDGGISWVSFATFNLPSNSSFNFIGHYPIFANSYVLAPDGSIYISIDSTSQASTIIEKLAPNSTSWQQLVKPSVEQGPDTVSWDDSGHPKALWVSSFKSLGNNNVQPLIQYHAA